MPVTVEVVKQPEEKVLGATGTELDLETATLSQLIQRAGLLDEETKMLTAGIFKDLTAVKNRAKELMAHGLAPSQKKEEKAGDFLAKIGEVGNTREISDMEALYKLLGHKDFMAICSVALGQVDKYTTEPQRKKFIKKERKGARSFSVIRIKEKKAASGEI